jgi:hypothetical protein
MKEALEAAMDVASEVSLAGRRSWGLAGWR